MKIKRYLLFLIMFIIIEIFNINFIFAKALSKEQTIINIENNSVTFISEKGDTNSKTLNTNSFLNVLGDIYINLNSLGDIINKDINYNYDTDKNVIEIYDDDKKFFDININTLSVNIDGGIKVLGKKVIIDNSLIYVPFRNIMNILGYDDEEIIYNSFYKTISLNKNSIFDVNSITIVDNFHWNENKFLLNNNMLPEELRIEDEWDILTKFDVTDKALLDELAGVLNEESFYDTDAICRCIYSDFRLELDNGFRLDFYKRRCRVFYNGNDIGNYQITFRTSLTVEKFIKDSFKNSGIYYNEWWYDTENKEDMYSQEYIICDYKKGDFKPILNYIASKIDDFENYNYTSDKDDDFGATITITKNNNKQTYYIKVNDEGTNVKYLDYMIEKMENNKPMYPF